jgi:membrane protein implicated in regulation of membrane protease activity
VGVYVQIILFLVISFILLLLIRPWAQKYFNRDRIRTNAQTLIGETAIVLEPIDNLRSQGRVSVKGQEWAARNVKEGELLEKDTRVKIMSISGVKLMVEKIAEQ